MASSGSNGTMLVKCETKSNRVKASCGFRCLWSRLGFNEGLGFRVQGLGFRVAGLGFRVLGLGLRI